MGELLFTDELLKTLHRLMLLCGVSIPEHHLDSRVSSILASVTRSMPDIAVCVADVLCLMCLVGGRMNGAYFLLKFI